METINVLAKCSFREIIEPKSETCLRNNGRSSVGDSKYRSFFSISYNSLRTATDGESGVKIIYFSFFFLFLVFVCFKMEEITKRKLTI